MMRRKKKQETADDEKPKNSIDHFGAAKDPSQLKSDATKMISYHMNKLVKDMQELESLKKNNFKAKKKKSENR